MFSECNFPESEPELTLAEIKHCVKTLETLFGVLEENIADEVTALDLNKDGMISKQEAKDALANLRCCPDAPVCAVC